VAGLAKCGVLDALRQTAPPGYTTNDREIVENDGETNVLIARDNIVN